MTEFKEYIDLAKRHDLQFRLNAVRYYEEHKGLSLRRCGEKFDISGSALGKWRKELLNTDDYKSLDSSNNDTGDIKEIEQLKSTIQKMQGLIDDLIKAFSSYRELFNKDLC